MRIPPPDLLTTLGVYLAALLIAFNEGMARSPAITAKFPAFKMGGNWNYVPLMILAVVGVVWLFRALTPSPPARPVSVTLASKEAVPAPPRKVSQAPLRAERTYLPEAFSQNFLDLASDRGGSLQINALLRPEAGKWIRLTANVVHMEEGEDGVKVQLSSARETSFFVVFSPTWAAQLARLKTGSEISFEAQIVDGRSVSLEHAELI